MFTGSKEKAHREQMGYVRTGILCKKDGSLVWKKFGMNHFLKLRRGETWK